MQGRACPYAAKAAAFGSGEKERALVRPVVLGTSIVLILASLLMILLVLLHKGKGGGLSDLFGGGITSSLSSSSVVERNLDRLTVATGIIWFVCIVGLLFLLQ